jgi:hypothetical protein
MYSHLVNALVDLAILRHDDFLSLQSHRNFDAKSTGDSRAGGRDQDIHPAVLKGKLNGMREAESTSLANAISLF